MTKICAALLATVSITAASVLLPAVAAGAPGSTAAVNELMSHLSGGYSPADCHPIDIQAHQQARIECGQNHDPGGPQLTIYTLYVDTTAMNAQYQVTLNDNTLLTFPDGTTSPADWFFDQSRNLIAGSDALIRRPEDGVINMLWTNSSLRRLAVAVPAGDPAELQKWSLANWSESAVIEVHDPATGIAVWAHFSRMPAVPQIWESDLIVFDEHGTLLVSRSFSRSSRADEAGGIVRMRCVEPGQQWSLSFDSMATRVTSAESLAAPIGDGDVEHVTVDLLFDGIHPLWSAGGVMRSQSWGTGHVEQAGRITGHIAVNGRGRAIDGYGFRDHSYGPRDYAKMVGDTWVNGVFPDGTALLALSVWADPIGSAPTRLGFYWDGEAMHGLHHSDLTLLAAYDGSPDQQHFTASYSNGTFEVEFTKTHRMGFTLQTPVGMSLGADPARPGLATVVESPVILRKGGQAAYGWCEQSRRRSELSS